LAHAHAHDAYIVGVLFRVAGAATGVHAGNRDVFKPEGS
jgi:hypothetical protein